MILPRTGRVRVGDKSEVLVHTRIKKIHKKILAC
jgi:hypothetical protein